jgi:hypothetical protein
LAEAREIAPAAPAKLVKVEPVAVLLREAEAEQATLVAVGSHGRGRAAGMVLGTPRCRISLSALQRSRCRSLGHEAGRKRPRLAGETRRARLLAPRSRGTQGGRERAARS